MRLGIDNHPASAGLNLGQGLGKSVWRSQGAKRGSRFLGAVHRSMASAEAIVPQDGFDRPAPIEAGAVTSPHQILDLARVVERNSPLFWLSREHAILNAKDQGHLLIERSRRLMRFRQKPVDRFRVFSSRPGRNLMERKDNNRARNGGAKRQHLPHGSKE